MTTNWLLTLTATTKLCAILLGIASNDFGASYYEIQTIKMGYNHFGTFVTFQYGGLRYLGMYCTLSIEV